MVDSAGEIQCPACAHKFQVGSDADLSDLTCPRCEAEIPEEALRGIAEIAEELAPGFRPGQKLGNYVIESLLGAGGMAVVFRGRQLSLNRHVAIKILSGQLARNKMFVERFESEAAVLASLNHRNIVGVIDRGMEDDTYFIVMEYIEGETLKDLLRQKERLTPDELFPVARHTLEGLGYAHKRGVVHRDIKPGNIMINREGEAKIADFGLAHLAKARGGLDVTRDNQAMGTLKYMAPEQLTSAKHVDGRADLYSFGVCLYEMLTGNLPLGTFKTPSEFDASLDVRWDDLILRALKPDQDERYQTAEEMAKDIQALSTTPRISLKERERVAEEEEAKAVARAEVAEVTCAECGHESAPAARKCERCGTSLADLFDACPKCRQSNRIDIATCPKCRTDLRAHREKKRAAARGIQKRAKQLESEQHFRSAIKEAQRLLALHTREYTVLRKQARTYIEQVERRIQRDEERAYDAGKRMIAEDRYASALKLWQPLADEYRDVAHWREEIHKREDEAKVALGDASRLYKAGDLQGAFAAWTKAARFWPHDKNLRKQLSEARLKLGNLKLKQSYLKEAQQAERVDNIAEAAALANRVLELDPTERTAQVLLERLKAKERKIIEIEAAAEPEIILRARRPRKRRKRLSPAVLGLIASAAGVLIVLFLIFGVLLPHMRAKREGTASRLLSEAESARSEGRYDKAIERCERILKRYAVTSVAPTAEQLCLELREHLSKARALCEEADELVQSGALADLETGFDRFRRLIAKPPVSDIQSYRTYAEERLEELRKAIALALASEAAELERAGEWRTALERYTTAAEQYRFTRDPIGAGLKVAGERLAECAQQVAHAREATEAADWDQALDHCRKALDMVPADPDANELLARIAEQIKPPDGMVFVPGDTYTIGGGEGNPKRTFLLRQGFYMDRTEVTNAHYAEFVAATKHPAPPGWAEAGKPRPDTEDLPVVNITWDDANAFAEWAGCILPSEALWECAARGPAGRAYSWGDDWEEAAVLGFGPAPPGRAERDRSPSGCLNMIGNVAEWTADPADTPPHTGPAGRSPQKETRFFIVKGSSWAGTERGRPTVVIYDQPGAGGGARPRPTGAPWGRARPPATRPSAGPPQGPAPTTGGSSAVSRARHWAGPPRPAPQPIAPAGPQPPPRRVTPTTLTILTPDPASPERPLRFPSDLEMLYLGQYGTGDQARVLVRKWLPEWGQWAEKAFTPRLGDTIGGPVPFTVKGPNGEGRGPAQREEVDLSTGCTAVGQEYRKWLEIRTPAGALRRLPRTKARPKKPILTAVEKKPTPAPEHNVAEAAKAAARMVGRSDGRYANVGFRCAKRLWTPPAVADRPPPGRADRPPEAPLRPPRPGMGTRP